MVILEGVSTDLGYNSLMKSGIRAFRRFIAAVRYYEVPGRANTDWHSLTCVDVDCEGYCEFHSLVDRESRRIFPNDFFEVEEGGVMKTYIWWSREDVE